MGLDGVEIVMEIEDRFGITFREDEAVACVTVGDVIALVLSRIAAAESAYCPTRPAFFVLRRDLREFLGDNSLRLRPRDRIEDIIPARARRSFWQWFANRHGLYLPDLRLLPAVRYSLAALCVGLAIASLLPGAIDVAILPASMAVAAILIMLLLILARPFRVVVPAGLSTLGDLAGKVASTTVAVKVPSPADAKSSAPDVVCDIIAEILSVDRAKVVPDAHLVKDLGMS